MQELTSEDWDSVVTKSDKTTMVEFWAPWCPWCRRLTPLIKELESDYGEKMTFTMLNTEDYPDIAAKNGVMSLPTTRFFCRGREVGEFVGYQPIEMLRQEFDKIIDQSEECVRQSSPVK
jgi:thioredoxin 1